MSDKLARLFDEYDRGRLSRRQLLQALGIAVAIRPISALAFPPGAGQDPAGARGQGQRQGPPPDTTPAPLPFEATGWKTVLLDHFSCQGADYAKEAAYYPALMNWKIRSDDGKQAVLDIGDWGGLIIRGGYRRRRRRPRAPAPAGRRRRGRSARARRPGRTAAAPRNARVRRLLLGHRAVGREEGRSRIEETRTRRPSPTTTARLPELPREGSGRLRSADQQRQPEESPQGRGERQDDGAGAVRSTDWKTVWLDHISFEVHELQGDGCVLQRAARLEAGTRRRQPEPVRDRRRRRHHHPPRRRRPRAGRADAPPPPRRATIGHISFGIQPFDPDEVKAELDKRGLIGARGHRRQAATSTRRRTRATTRPRRTDSICRSARRRRRIAAPERGRAAKSSGRTGRWESEGEADDDGRQSHY